MKNTHQICQRNEISEKEEEEIVINKLHHSSPLMI